MADVSSKNGAIPLERHPIGYAKSAVFEANTAL
jgi:hypothetical protein